MRARTTVPRTLRRAVALLSVVTLAACADSSQAITAPPGVERTACGTVSIAVNLWVGYAANVAVVSYLLKQELGWTRLRPRSPETAERWSWLLAAGLWQLWSSSKPSIAVRVATCQQLRRWQAASKGVGSRPHPPRAGQPEHLTWHRTGRGYLGRQVGEEIAQGHLLNGA